MTMYDVKVTIPDWREI